MSQSRIVALCPQERLQGVWPLVVEQLDAHPSLWLGSTKEAIWERLVEGDYRLWAVAREGDGKPELWFITATVDYPACRNVEIIWAVGEGLDQWLEIVLSAVDRWAELEEADWVLLKGRPGWVKPTAKFGYEVHSVSLRKAVGRTRVN